MWRDTYSFIGRREATLDSGVGPLAGEASDS
jgi:hypothetical protein